MKKALTIMAAIWLLAACGRQTAPPERLPDEAPSMGMPAPGTEAVEEMIVEDAAPPVAEPERVAPDVKAFSITARQWEFSPSVITVKRGDTVKLSIVSEDVAHGFSMADFGVSERLEPGKTVTVEFVADKTGTFPFFCNFFCGSGHGGMDGRLIVE